MLNYRSGKRVAKLFPSEDPSDRIVNQLMYIPPEYSEETAPMKKILVYNSLGSWNIQKEGQSRFIKDKCPVNKCILTANREEAANADAILYKDQFILPSVPRPPNQVYMLTQRKPR